ncbi:insulinase family protein [Alteromonas oceanisediminis]|uniref:insulinase family protein n=1 Tax=Alteromonas oceanisediminis TaxID=2836180 RepID=UPI001BDA66AC|nr:insulinase family protein [Alteromonas oceanisediminis]MBT0587525.1 insulinase family protein [Alteromonas oceanisediminis]
MTLLNRKSSQCQQFVLDNGVKLLHVKTSKPGKTAFAAAIGSGHFDDPADCQGLHHLLEHMLFMGSENWPEPNQAIETIERLGGSLNAFTSTETMTVQGECHSMHLRKTFSVLADMLEHPLFNHNAINAEIDTIDAEFRFKQNDDLRRLYQVHKETANPQHPFSQFSVGNKHIFQQYDVAALKRRLHALHDSAFCGQNVCVTVVSDLEMSVILPIAKATLGAIPTGEQRSKPELPPLYTANELGVEIVVKPLSDTRRLILTFALPALTIEDIPALGFISHLLGDESKGSILSVLKKRGWVSSLNAGGGIDGRNFKDLNINMQVSAEGAHHRYDIAHAIFTYLGHLSGDEPQQWRLEERRNMDKLHCQQRKVLATSELAGQLANGLFRFDAESLCQLEFEAPEYNLSSIKHLLAQLNPSTLRLKYISQSVATDNIAQWYDTPYAMTHLSKETIRAWSAPTNESIDLQQLSLPQPNPYVSAHGERRSGDFANERPKRFWQQKNAEVWIAGHADIKQPLADCYLSFEFPTLVSEPAMMAAKKAWVSSLCDAIQGDFYAAEIAGLHYRIYGHQGGLSIHTSGFSLKQKDLVSKLTNALFTHSISPERFTYAQDALARSLQNSLLNKPVNRLFSRLGVLMQRYSHAPQAVLSALNTLSLEDTLNYRAQALNAFSVQGFLHGQWRASDADAITTLLAEKTHVDYDYAAISRDVVKLTPQYTYFHHVDSQQSDSAAMLFLQAPSSSAFHTALTMVLEQMLTSPFFSVLRTQKKLGYIVGSGFVTHNARAGMVFYVQSPSADAQTLVNEITQFLITQLEHIDYYREFWPQIQQNIIRQLRCTDISSTARAQRLWMSLGLNDTQFNRNEQMANHVSALTFENLVAHAVQLQQRQSFGELVLFSHGNGSVDESFAQRDNAKILNDVDVFKSQMTYL